LQQVGKVGEAQVAQRPGPTPDLEQTAAATLHGRVMRDQFFGQVKVEIGNFHRTFSIFPGAKTAAGQVT
jgi:hypothetical protein